MNQITAQQLSHDSFAPFGHYWPRGEARSGEGYAFSSTLYPAFRGGDDEEPSLGITEGASLAVQCAAMERHFHTTETLFAFDQPAILCVALPGGEAPDGNDVRAFVLEPGDVVRLNRGVWHDACRGIAGPVTYGWLADCRAPLDPWIEIDGGPLQVSVDRFEPDKSVGVSGRTY